MAFEKKPYKRYGTYRKEKSNPAYKPRRGTLSPLMSEEAKSSANIQQLSYDFACRIVRLYQYLTEDSDYKELIMSKQVYRLGTSIGANCKEAQHAQSDADFLSKMQIALKEANETDYWLNLIYGNGYLNDDQFASINKDCVRILKLLNTIVRTTRNKIGK